MISNNNTNLNLSYHPPNPCLLLLPRSLMLSISSKGMHDGGHACLSFLVLYVHRNHQAEILHTGRQTHRQTDRKTDTQADRQEDRHTGRQAGRQTDRKTDTQEGTQGGKWWCTSGGVRRALINSFVCWLSMQECRQSGVIRHAGMQTNWQTGKTTDRWTNGQKRTRIKLKSMSVLAAV